MTVTGKLLPYNLGMQASNPNGDKEWDQEEIVPVRG